MQPPKFLLVTTNISSSFILSNPDISLLSERLTLDVLDESYRGEPDPHWRGYLIELQSICLDHHGGPDPEPSQPGNTDSVRGQHSSTVPPPNLTLVRRV